MKRHTKTAAALTLFWLALSIALVGYRAFTAKPLPASSRTTAPHWTRVDFDGSGHGRIPRHLASPFLPNLVGWTRDGGLIDPHREPSLMEKIDDFLFEHTWRHDRAFEVYLLGSTWATEMGKGRLGVVAGLAGLVGFLAFRRKIALSKGV